MRTYVDLKFADGEYRFALPLPQIDELQDATKTGIGALYARVLQGRVPDGKGTIGHPGYAAFFAADLRETVRQGLIGGGQGMVNGADVKVTALRANELVERYVLPLPLSQQWDIAAAVLFATVEGYEPEPDELPRVTPTDEPDEKKN